MDTSYPVKGWYQRDLDARMQCSYANFKTRINNLLRGTGFSLGEWFTLSGQASVTVKLEKDGEVAVTFRVADSIYFQDADVRVFLERDTGACTQVRVYPTSLFGESFIKQAIKPQYKDIFLACFELFNHTDQIAKELSTKGLKGEIALFGWSLKMVNSSRIKTSSRTTKVEVWYDWVH